MTIHIPQIIIGAGIAGLSYAHRCPEDFLLVESRAELGGSWQSYGYKNSLYEFGPNSFMNRCPELDEMIDACGMREQLVSHEFKKSKRYLYQDGKLKPVGPKELIFGDLLSARTKLSVLTEFWRRNQARSEDESMHEFFSRRFSNELADFLGHAVKGIWAGDATQLSIAAALPGLQQAEAKHGSILSGLLRSKAPHNDSKKQKLATCSFLHGMSSFCEALGDYIGREKIITEAETQVLSYDGELYHLEINGVKYSCKKLVLACKAYQAADLLAAIKPGLAESLNQIEYADIELTALSLKKDFLRDEAHSVLDAFGFINADSSLNTLGVIFSSQLFEERRLEDEFLFTSFGRGHASHSGAAEELKTILQAYASTDLKTKDFKLVNQLSLSRAIPQYNIGYSKILRAIESELDSNLVLIGNYIGGVSLKDTIVRSFEQASQDDRGPLGAYTPRMTSSARI